MFALFLCHYIYFTHDLPFCLHDLSKKILKCCLLLQHTTFLFFILFSGSYLEILRGYSWHSTDWNWGCSWWCLGRREPLRSGDKVRVPVAYHTTFLFLLYSGLESPLCLIKSSVHLHGVLPTASFNLLLIVCGRAYTSLSISLMVLYLPLCLPQTSAKLSSVLLRLSVLRLCCFWPFVVILLCYFTFHI